MTHPARLRSFQHVRSQIKNELVTLIKLEIFIFLFVFFFLSLLIGTLSARFFNTK